ncbi:TPA: hypothetical protein O4F91_000521 [Vibrio alginolyticus]|nr:hypothetical protein [Vibrio sp. 2CM40D]EKK7179060.1 hypothetical protein [Vibrio alginolyticus]MCK8111390.1 hypothetical protein [Vibrio sp. 2CM40D]HCZ9033937.1 hypothetical protein [Vibrio alginolyticus]HCZ9052998.1 hypothetical protein [Vibrio alginolyticus]
MKIDLNGKEVESTEFSNAELLEHGFTSEEIIEIRFNEYESQRKPISA